VRSGRAEWTPILARRVGCRRNHAALVGAGRPPPPLALRDGSDSSFHGDEEGVHISGEVVRTLKFMVARLALGNPTHPARSRQPLSSPVVLYSRHDSQSAAFFALIGMTLPDRSAGGGLSATYRLFRLAPLR